MMVCGGVIVLFENSIVCQCTFGSHLFMGWGSDKKKLYAMMMNVMLSYGRQVCHGL